MYSNYPIKASKNAQEGYILNRIKGNCNNSIGVQTAIKLINRQNLSLSFIKKIHSYLERARVYVGDKNKCGYISYQLWGGDAMLHYTRKKLKNDGKTKAK